MREEFLGRWMFASGGLEKGFLRLVAGRVEEVCWGEAPGTSTKALILPGLVNSHVHIGDFVAYPAPKGSVQEIVGPPNGHKHKILKSKPTAEKIAAMKNASEIMSASGTTLFGDFREEGIDGVLALRSAMEGSLIQMRVFGRPSSPHPDESEVDALLAQCDGIGMSALSDWPYDLLRRLSTKARSAGRSFAIHASETKREDIDAILDLKPDFLVHMCNATEGDVEACADSGVPIVVCPRSNKFFGLEPRIPRLLKAGVTAALGSDNGMIAPPDVIEEMKASYEVSKADGPISPRDIVNLATFNGRKVLNAEPKITTEISEQSDLVAVRVRGEDPLLELITESRSGDVLGVAQRGRLRRTSGWTR